MFEDLVFPRDRIQHQSPESEGGSGPSSKRCLNPSFDLVDRGDTFDRVAHSAATTVCLDQVSVRNSPGPHRAPSIPGLDASNQW
jgi:hypothetical protein